MKMKIKYLELIQDDGADSEINSDLDDDESEENIKTDHIILCQYEKVSRIKNKWKCVLKDGVGHINGRDYVFNRVFYVNIRPMVILNGNSIV
jgi:transcription initiation factor TFIIA large subunit